MEFILDTANIDAIKKYMSVIPLSGITTNPSIVKKEGKIPFFKQMKEIKQLIGDNRTFHIQVVGVSTKEIIDDAHTIQNEIGADVYIKIPTNEAGLSAMKILKDEGAKITATAIYSTFQGYLAAQIGVDYLAPYYNRMVNMNINADQVISNLSNQINRSNLQTKILAASFHTVQQVNSALENGALAVTMGPDILSTGLGNSVISDAVDDFTKDWQTIYGNTTIYSLEKQSN